MVPRRPRHALTPLTVIVPAFVLGVFAVVFILTSVSKPNASFPKTIVCGILTARQSASYADLVVTGTVFAVVPGEEYAQILFTPDRVYKGTIPDQGIRIASVAVDGNVKRPRGDDAPDLHFTSEDPPYLLFLRKREDGAFLTSRCYGSRILGSGLTDDERSALGDGQEVKNQ